ncbi:MAG: putative quinol monooxygenase [Streptosporangiaceae bacterium]
MYLCGVCRKASRRACHARPVPRARESRRIIITGSITGRPDTIGELVAASLEHVRRSRGEPGCISHAVYRDVENPLRLVFIEQWAHMALARTGASRLPWATLEVLEAPSSECLPERTCGDGDDGASAPAGRCQSLP